MVTLGLNFCAASLATCVHCYCVSKTQTSAVLAIFFFLVFKYPHTKALDFLMCSCRNRNCRLRLLRSIVSRSTTWISPKPVRTRSFKSSQPMPPAPTIRTRACKEYRQTESKALVKQTGRRQWCYSIIEERRGRVSRERSAVVARNKTPALAAHTARLIKGCGSKCLLGQEMAQHTGDAPV